MDITRPQAGTAKAPVSFTNVPDPASKTLERTANAESSDLGGISTQPSSDLQSQPHRTSKQNADSEILTTSCLFCTNSVIIESFNSASQIDNVKAQELHQVIKNLYSHMHLDSHKLPNLNDYTKIKFPFCKSCDALLETLHQSQKIIEAAEARITETVFKIEKVVTISELGKLNWNNKPSSSPGAIEQKKFFPLRNMILEVIRNKFNQNTFPSSSAACSATVNKNCVDESSKKSAEKLPILNQNDVDESSKKSDDELPIGDQNDPNTSSKESEVELLNEDSSVYIYENREVQDLQRENTEQNSNLHDEPLVISPNARYNVENNENSRDTSNVIENNDESSPPQDDEDNNPSSHEMPTPPPPPPEISNKRRKIQFEDVETDQETCPKRPAHYIQHKHHPDFNQITRKNKLRKYHPLMDFHQAIIDAEQNCRPCKSKTTPVKKSPVIKVRISECDICGRPVNGGLRNLMEHKFTHKNDEERIIAIRNKEQGACKKFLSRKWVSLPVVRLPSTFTNK